MPGLVNRIDAFQRRHPVIGFPLAVVYKFFDDQGPYLAVILTYYAFVAIFPLLLIASSILGFVLQDNPKLAEELLESALGQFPIVGTQLGTPEGITGSASAVVLGSLAALYGVLGLGQAAQNAVNVTLAVPRNSRLNPIVSRLRSFVMLSLAGTAVLAVATAATILSQAANLTPDLSQTLTRLLTLAAVVANTAVLAVLLRLATSHHQTWRAVLPGAITIAVLWQALQVGGEQYVRHVVVRASDMNATFALVLGLMAFLYLATVIGVIGLEVNVVTLRRLYPRALLTPFTDAVDLTDADRRVYRDYARAQRHKGFERIDVTFDK